MKKLLLWYRGSYFIIISLGCKRLILLALCWSFLLWVIGTRLIRLLFPCCLISWLRLCVCMCV